MVPLAEWTGPRLSSKVFKGEQKRRVEESQLVKENISILIAAATAACSDADSIGVAPSH